jgi:hypothetical protein
MSVSDDHQWCDIKGATVGDFKVSSSGIEQTGYIVMRGMLKKILFRLATESQSGTEKDQTTWHLPYPGISPEAKESTSNEVPFEEPAKPWHLVIPESDHSTAGLTKCAPDVFLDRVLDGKVRVLTAYLVPMNSDDISLRCLILKEHHNHEHEGRVFRRLGMCFLHHSHQGELKRLPNPYKDMGLDFWDIGFGDEVEANKTSFVLV